MKTKLFILTLGLLFTCMIFQSCGSNGESEECSYCIKSDEYVCNKCGKVNKKPVFKFHINYDNDTLRYCSDKCYNKIYGSSSDEKAPDGYHKGGSCNECGGTGRTQQDIVGTRGDDTGSQCASCSGKGFHWVKD